MAFSFRDQSFHLIFQKNTNIAKYVVENDRNYKREFVLLAGFHLNIYNIFENENDDFDLDSLIFFSRSKFDYLKLLSQVSVDLIDYNDEIKLNEIMGLNLSLIYIYLSELNFRIAEQESSLKIQIEGFLGRARKSLVEGHSYYINYAEQKLAYEILKEKFHFLNYEKSQNLEQRMEGINNFIKKWEESFKEKEKSVLELEKRLEDTKQTYDFVLLNKGFKELYEQKKEELKSRKDGYSAFGAMLFLTPLCSIVLFIFLYFSLGQEALKFIIYLSLPITTFMIIVFYFVRVGLQHVRSVQSQMMQLELRMALCQFIHNYAEDSEKLHAKNKAGFEKFENIIFSPLVSSDDKIPTTFDGMEQLAKLVSEFRKS